MNTQDAQEREATKAAEENRKRAEKKQKLKNKLNSLPPAFKKAMIFLAVKVGAILLGMILVFGIVGVVLDLFSGGDPSAFDNNSMTDISGLQGNTVQEKVWLALRELGYSEYAVAGAMGNIHYESSRI